MSLALVREEAIPSSSSAFQAVAALRDDLANSASASKGASLVGVLDLAGNYPEAAKTVEAVLAAIAARAYGESLTKHGGNLAAAFAVSSAVFVERGAWEISANIIAPTDACLVGIDREKTSITFTGAGTFLTLTAGGYSHIEGVSIYGDPTGPAYFTAGTRAVEINGNLTMRRARIRNFERAIDWVSDGFYLKFWDCDFAYNKVHWYNVPGNNTEGFGCRFAFSDYAIQIGGFDGPLTLHGGSIENVTTAGVSLIFGGQTTVNLIGLYVENVGATSTAGTGLAAAGFKAASLVQGAFKDVTIVGTTGQIMGFRRVTDLSYAGVNLTSIGNRWIYKLDAGLSDTEYIHRIGDASRVLINDTSEGRSDLSYTPAATYTIAGALLTSYSGGPNGPMGVDPVSGVPLEAGLTARVQLPYSASIATNSSLGKSFSIVATNATPFTISNPTNGYTGQPITYRIQNGSGGALGALTWGAAFKLAGSAWTQPANGTSRAITFEYDGAAWKEISRSAADVPN